MSCLPVLAAPKVPRDLPCIRSALAPIRDRRPIQLGSRRGFSEVSLITPFAAHRLGSSP